MTDSPDVQPDAVKITKPHKSQCIEYDHLKGVTLSEDSELEPLFSAETIQETIDRVWQNKLKDCDNSDVALGMKILARELKQGFKEGDNE